MATNGLIQSLGELTDDQLRQLYGMDLYLADRIVWDKDRWQPYANTISWEIISVNTQVVDGTKTFIINPTLTAKEVKLDFIKPKVNREERAYAMLEDDIKRHKIFGRGRKTYITVGLLILAAVVPDEINLPSSNMGRVQQSVCEFSKKSLSVAR